MPSTIKRLPKTAAAEAAPAKAVAQPFLRFVHSPALRKQSLSVLTALEQADAPVEHRGALADMVVALTAAGLEGYFVVPLKQAKAGFLTEQSAKLGLAGVQQLMGGVIRNIIGRMD
ncbi:hypothetical protein, partial [Roseateles sp.]|uniref:hypothetical protein n=1 Tax=Roseateles sp. TaxID=1971397 RepID=UPI00286AB140